MSGNQKDEEAKRKAEALRANLRRRKAADHAAPDTQDKKTDEDH